jgi:hypothetical protein
MLQLKLCSKEYNPISLNDEKCVFGRTFFCGIAVKFKVSGFRFQAGNYPTFHPAWKAVLSAAMVAWDAVSGK